MVFEDCIGLKTDEAVALIKASHPYQKIVVHPTMAPRFKGTINLSEAMVVRQNYEQGVLELTVVMVD